jgi:DNA-binding NtrC family response regulator
MSARAPLAPVLIVEDEDDMCWALRTIVEAEGHATQAVQTAHGALAALPGAPFALAFVDLKLTDMEGLELIARLRSRRPGLRCVLVTGYLYEDDEAVRAGLRDGLIAGFIGKPFLLRQVRDALRLAGAGRPMPP